MDAAKSNLCKKTTLGVVSTLAFAEYVADATLMRFVIFVQRCQDLHSVGQIEDTTPT
jgi:hypothetical protein